MACERQKQALVDAQDALDALRAQCEDGLKGACGKIAAATRAVAAAQKAYDDCIRSAPTPPPTPPPPPPPPPTAKPCVILESIVADLQGKLEELQDLCRSGQHLACAAILNVRRQLAKAQIALRNCKYPSESKVIRQGDTTKINPYRILIIANPVLRTHPTATSTRYAVDPILSDKAGFDAAVTYINQCLFGEQLVSVRLGPSTRQAERWLADPSLKGKIWVESLFIQNLEATEDHALVEEAWASNIINPLQDNFDGLARYFGHEADVIFAVTKSPTHNRASAYPVKDDTSNGGVPFTFDGNNLTHCYYNLAPGVVAIHSSASTLTALHEFGHAASSDSNGFVTDLYVDNPSSIANTINFKTGRPIPSSFASLDSTPYASDKARDGLGYPAGWTSYHCQLNDATRPALMDNYKNNPQLTAQIRCRHDRITRQFLLDRINAKTQRP